MMGSSGSELKMRMLDRVFLLERLVKHCTGKDLSQLLP